MKEKEKDKGSLEAGKLADLVVLSQDVLAEAKRDCIAETEVLLTMVGGRVVYASDPLSFSRRAKTGREAGPKEGQAMNAGQLRCLACPWLRPVP